ncbi:MAG TPA: hypothetical protein VI756_33270 [Blastocatellia bacterium]
MIALDNTSNSGADQSNVTSIGWTHDNVAGNCIVVGIVSDSQSSTAPAVTAVTYNGISLTEVPSTSQADTSGTTRCRVSIWYLLAPATGSNSIVVTVAPSITQHVKAWAASLTGVNQTTPIDNSGAGEGSHVLSSVTFSLSSAADWIFDVIGSTDPASLSPNAGQTSEWLQTGSKADGGGSLAESVSSGSVTVGWSTSGATTAYAAVAFAPAPLTGSDAATESESETIAGSTSGSDAGTESESDAIAAHATGTDAGTLGEAPSVTGSDAGSDEATLSESGTVTDHVAGADSATLSESGRVRMAGEDAATESEGGVLKPQGATDSATLSESGRIRQASADSATLGESDQVKAHITATDQGGLSESASPAYGDTPQGIDSATMSESGAVDIVVQGVSAADSATLSESGRVRVAAADAASESETGGVRARITGTDSGSLGESSPGPTPVQFSNRDFIYQHLPARYRTADALQSLLLYRFLQPVGATMDGWDAIMASFYQNIHPATAADQWVTWWMWALFGWYWYPKWFTLDQKRALYAAFTQHLARRGTAIGIKNFLAAFSIEASVDAAPTIWGQFAYGQGGWQITKPLGVVVQIRSMNDEVNAFDGRSAAPTANAPNMWGQAVYGQSFYRKTCPTLTRREIEDLVRFEWPNAQRVMMDYVVFPAVSGAGVWDSAAPVLSEAVVPDEAGETIAGANW